MREMADATAGYADGDFYEGPMFHLTFNPETGNTGETCGDCHVTYLRLPFTSILTCWLNPVLTTRANWPPTANGIGTHSWKLPQQSMHSAMIFPVTARVDGGARMATGSTLPAVTSSMKIARHVA